MSVVVVIVTLVILKNQIGQDWNTKLYPTGATQILWTYAFWVNSINSRLSSDFYMDF